MRVKRSNRLLVHEKLSRFFPYSFSLNCFIECIFAYFDVESVGERVDLLIEESNVVLRILSSQINVL